MQPSRILLLAGAVTAGAIGLAGLAYAGDSGLKTLGLQWPGGAVVQIVTTQPQAKAMPDAAMPVAFPMPLPVPVAMNAPATSTPFAASADPFAQMDRMSAMLDQQADAMMRATQVMIGMPLPGPNALMPAAFAHLPAGGGSASYSFVSISGGAGGGCMQSIEIISPGQGLAPHVVRQSAGNCGGHAMIGTPAVNHVAPPPAEAAPQLLRVRDLRPVSVPQASQT